jgi:magnesium transporter
MEKRDYCMLNAYLLNDCRLETVETARIEERLDDIIWIDLVSPSREEEQLVEKLLCIDIPTRDEMTGLELSNRLYQEDDATFMVATLISRTDGDYAVIPYIFVLLEKQIVTVRYHDSEPFHALIAKLQKKKSIKVLRHDLILLDLLEGIVNRLADVLEENGHKLDMISKHIFRTSEIKGSAEGTDKSTVSLYASIRESGVQGDIISMVKESLISLGRLVGYTRQVAILNQNPTNDERIRTIASDVAALSEHTTFLTDKITFLLDATLGMIGIQQNAVMKIFTILAVFFMPPTLIAGIYGMNFKFLPELDWHYGYPFAIFIMILSAYLPYRFFKKRGWL